MTRYIKKQHKIDSDDSATAEKRIRERTAINMVIFRGTETNIKVSEQRRREMMSIRLDKATLKYICNGPSVQDLHAIIDNLNEEGAMKALDAMNQ